MVVAAASAADAQKKYDAGAVEQMQMSRFNGEHGELFGSAIAGELGTQ
jgi:hypothetical protein